MKTPSRHASPLEEGKKIPTRGSGKRLNSRTSAAECMQTNLTPDRTAPWAAPGSPAPMERPTRLATAMFRPIKGMKGHHVPIERHGHRRGHREPAGMEGEDQKVERHNVQEELRPGGRTQPRQFGHHRPVETEASAVP